MMMFDPVGADFTDCLNSIQIYVSSEFPVKIGGLVFIPEWFANFCTLITLVHFRPLIRVRDDLHRMVNGCADTTIWSGIQPFYSSLLI